METTLIKISITEGIKEQIKFGERLIPFGSGLLFSCLLSENVNIKI
jgi:hypothetical protein